MKNTVPHLGVIAAAVSAVAILAAQTPTPSQQPASPSSPSEISTTVRGEPGAPPHYAVPDFIPLTTDKETADAAKLIAQVLWDDLAFEREFDMIPRDTYRTIEQIPTTDTIAFERWRELGADGVIVTGDSKLAQAIIDLGDSFGLQVVAEGIEHDLQRRRLIELGCRLGQGYCFARPMPAADLSALLAPGPLAARC
jgi:hypothetical protein